MPKITKQKRRVKYGTRIMTFRMPDERVEFLAASFGQEMVGILYLLREELRRQLKYTDLNVDTRNVLEEIRKTLYEELGALPEELWT